MFGVDGAVLNMFGKYRKDNFKEILNKTTTSFQNNVSGTWQRYTVVKTYRSVGV